MLLLFFLAAITAYPIKRGIVDDLNSLLNLVIPALNGNNISNVRVIPVNVARIQGVNTASAVTDTSGSTSPTNSNVNSGTTVSNAGTGSISGMTGTADTGDNSGIAVLPIKAGSVSGIAIIPVPAQSKVAAVNKTPVGSGRLTSGEAEKVISVNPGRRFDD